MKAAAEVQRVGERIGSVFIGTKDTESKTATVKFLELQVFLKSKLYLNTLSSYMMIS